MKHQLPHTPKPPSPGRLQALPLETHGLQQRPRMGDGNPRALVRVTASVGRGDLETTQEVGGPEPPRAPRAAPGPWDWGPSLQGLPAPVPVQCPQAAGRGVMLLWTRATWLPAAPKRPEALGKGGPQAVSRLPQDAGRIQFLAGSGTTASWLWCCQDDLSQWTGRWLMDGQPSWLTTASPRQEAAPEQSLGSSPCCFLKGTAQHPVTPTLENRPKYNTLKSTHLKASAQQKCPRVTATRSGLRHGSLRPGRRASLPPLSYLPGADAHRLHAPPRP